MPQQCLPTRRDAIARMKAFREAEVFEFANFQLEALLGDIDDLCKLARRQVWMLGNRGEDAICPRTVWTAGVEPAERGVQFRDYVGAEFSLLAECDAWIGTGQGELDAMQRSCPTSIDLGDHFLQRGKAREFCIAGRDLRPDRRRNIFDPQNADGGPQRSARLDGRLFPNAKCQFHFAGGDSIQDRLLDQHCMFAFAEIPLLVEVHRPNSRGGLRCGGLILQ